MSPWQGVELPDKLAIGDYSNLINNAFSISQEYIKSKVIAQILKLLKIE